MALTDSLRALALAAKQARTPVAGVRRYWATIYAAGPPPLVRLDADATATPREVSANAVGAVAVGQRVQVELRAHRLTIVAAPGAP